MAHELEITNGAASFVYNALGGNPWHRLGEAVTGAMTRDEILRKSKGDYVVHKYPIKVVTPHGDVLVDEFVFTGRELDVLNKDGLIEADDDGFPKSETQLFAPVSRDYPVFDNGPLVDLALAVADQMHDARVFDTAGVMFNGRRFFCSMNLGEIVIDTPRVKDTISNYLAFMAAHDGSLGINGWRSRIRPVCNNTVTAGMNRAERRFVVKHSKQLLERDLVQEAQRALGFAIEDVDAFKALVGQLADVEASMRIMLQIADAIWERPKGDAVTERKLDNWEQRRETLMELYRSDRNSGFGDTGWAVYNTVAEFLDHCRKGANTTQRAWSSVNPSSEITKVKHEVAERVLAMA